MCYVALRTVAMGVCETLVTCVDAVVDTVADVGRVDTLAASQALKRAVATGCRTGAGHTAAVLSTSTSAATVSRTHRLRYRPVPSTSVAVPAERYTNETLTHASTLSYS